MTPGDGFSHRPSAVGSSGHDRDGGAYLRRAMGPMICGADPTL